jgi:prefoldin subunit 5
MSRKEKCMKIEAGIKRFESEVDEITKRMTKIQSKIEQRSISLKQVFIVF